MMPIRPLPVLAAALGIALAGAAHAASDTTRITLYRSNADSLFAADESSPSAGGFALVHERRTLDLKAGRGTTSVRGLPRFIDPEAIAVEVAGGTRVLGQRVLLGRGAAAALVGQPVEVLGSSGEPLASGTLLRADDGLLVRDADDRRVWVRQYAAVRARSEAPAGATLQLDLQAGRAGRANATLSYPTGGLDWRAAYVAELQPGHACRLRLQSHASVANRSGRDWDAVTLKLLAGEPRLAKAGGGPRLMAEMAEPAFRAPKQMPEQSTVGDYRLYRMAGPVDLPDASISELPLYETRSLDCRRISLYETGNRWAPPRPMLAPEFGSDGGTAVTSLLDFAAFDSLPAGYVRVLGQDRDGTAQLLGEDRLADIPKGGTAEITLGTAFDLHVQRERTSFHVDLPGRTMDESFRLVVRNTGEEARIITVRDHPGRWREWSLRSSSRKPSRMTPDLLEFAVPVPAGGQAVLDYAVHYTWSADQAVQ